MRYGTTRLEYFKKQQVDWLRNHSGGFWRFCMNGFYILGGLGLLALMAAICFVMDLRNP